MISFGHLSMRIKIDTVLLIICFLGASISIYAFYPGWMSPDSIFQYDNAVTGHYSAWHPVIMAWWWRILGFISDGPGPFLVQNLILFWLGFYFIASTLSKYIGWGSVFVLFLAATPSALIIMAQLWKDAVFTSLAIFGLGVTFNSVAARRYQWKIALLLIVILSLAIGCKPNGLPVAVLLFGWLFFSNPKIKNKISKLMLVFSSTCLVFVIPFAIALTLPVYKISPMQYMQSYDLLGIGVLENQVILPDYITKKVGINKDNAREFYFPGGNNLMFYNTPAGNLATSDINELKDLKTRWFAAIRNYPLSYLDVRYANFLALLRWGAVYPAVVAADVIVQNPWGYVFVPNFISDLYIKTINKLPYLYFPWVYLSITLLFFFVTKILPTNLRQFNVILSLLVFSFAMPHLFIAPAADFRYLHFSVVCTVVQIGMFLGCIFSAVFRK